MWSTSRKKLYVLRLAALGIVCMCITHVRAESPGNEKPTLQAQLDALSARARPGTFAIAVMDLRSGLNWGVQADCTVPMMSDFKAPVAAAVLARIDAGTMTMTQTIELSSGDVVPGSAVPSIGAGFQGESMIFTLAQLMKAAVSESDNTAVDALIRVLGGPGQVTAFLRRNGLPRMIVRDDERGIARLSNHLMGSSAPLSNETPEQQKQREWIGYRDFLSVSPNTTTPNSSALFLKKLFQNQLLSPTSTRYLLDLMYAQTTPKRLRSGLSADARLADKTGTSGIDGYTAAWNDMGLMTWNDGQAIVIAGYLSDTTATQAERDQLFADLARLVTKHVRSPKTKPF